LTISRCNDSGFTMTQTKQNKQFESPSTPAQLRRLEELVDAYEAGHTIRQLALVLDVAPSTVYQRLKRGRAKLRRPGPVPGRTP